MRIYNSPVIKYNLQQLLVCCVLLLSITVSAEDRHNNYPGTKSEYRGDGRALLGVSIHVIERQNSVGRKPRWAYQVKFILPNSAAHRHKIQVGDILLSWDKLTLDEVSTPQRQTQLSNYLKQQKRVGEYVTIEIERQENWLKDGTKKQELTQQSLTKLLTPPSSKNQSKQITIDYSRNSYTKRIQLGSRNKDIQLRDNHLLFPEAEKLLNPLANLPKLLVKLKKSQSQYADLLKRYEENQQWQEGFRLKRFQYLHRDPEKVLPVAQYFSDQLRNLFKNSDYLYGVLKEMSSWLDVEWVGLPAKLKIYPKSSNIQSHWDFIEKKLRLADYFHKRAFIKISPVQQQWLHTNLPELMQRFSKSYYINIDEDSKGSIDLQNRKALHLLKQIDYNQLLRATLVLQSLNNPAWHQQLRKYAKGWFKNQSVLTKDTDYGKIVLASEAGHIHHVLATALIDLGGNDRYLGVNNSANQALNILIDLEGDDVYSASVPYSQAATLMGISLLNDWQGDDDYIGSYYSQAVAIAGIAILTDYQGNDEYWGQRYAQGTAFWGLALLHDKQGNDNYSAWLYAQGVGGVKGVGVLFDETGNDRYHATGEEQSSYRTQGNFRSSSQGFGVGFRGYASGGFGALLDGSGQDEYRSGNFAMGTGYFYGMGILHDVGQSNDSYQASRYGLAASAHSAIGVFIDDGGDDNYAGNWVALGGVAWDLSISAFWDKQGEDSYHFANNSFSLGVAAHNGHSVFIDAQGQDNYYFSSEHQSIGLNDYHGGYSFSLLWDAGKQSDNYQPAKLKSQKLIYQKDNGFMLDSGKPLTEQLSIELLQQLEQQ